MGFVLINTADKYAEIAYFSEKNKIFSEKFLGEGKHSEKLLPLIKAGFSKRKIDFKDIQGVLVINGPGAFTALRVGISVANAIGYGLNVPVIALNLSEYQKLVQFPYDMFKGNKFDKIAVPFYDREPNITLKK